MVCVCIYDVREVTRQVVCDGWVESSCSYIKLLHVALSLVKHITALCDNCLGISVSAVRFRVRFSFQFPCATWVLGTVRLLKVTGTREITVTRFMQHMPILTPPSANLFLGSNPFRPAAHIIFAIRTSCKGEATRTHWPLPHEMLNSERIPQTFYRCVQNCIFSFSTQTEDVNIECEIYKSTSYSPHISR